MSVKRIGLHALAGALVVVLSGCNQSVEEIKNPVKDETAKIRKECIRDAQMSGYRSGDCAASYIQRCIDTQSRSEMASALQVDRQLGILGSSSCPNMPATYKAEFDKF